MGRYCGEDYGPAPLPSNVNDFVGHRDWILREAVKRRDDLIASTGVDWRVIACPFGYRVDRGQQQTVPTWLDPFPQAASS